jgi:Holliday junction resolvase RusA-like endonuclease
MEPEVVVVIPGKPRGQGSLSLWRAPDGTERAKNPPETIQHRNLVVGMLNEAWTEKNLKLTQDSFMFQAPKRAPLTGGVGVHILARFPRPKSHFGTGRNAGRLKDWAPRWVTTPTDGDKIARLVNDALTIAGVVGDDAQVSLLRVEKVYADAGPGETEVRVYALPDQSGA